MSAFTSLSSVSPSARRRLPQGEKRGADDDVMKPKDALIGRRIRCRKVEVAFRITRQTHCSRNAVAILVGVELCERVIRLCEKRQGIVQEPTLVLVTMMRERVCVIGLACERTTK